MTAGDPWEGQEAREWAERVRSTLIPMIRGSALTAAIVPEEPDVKAAVELGVTLLLGKPLMVVVPPGRAVPDGLVRAADAIVEMSDDPAVTQARIAEALRAIGVDL